MLNRKKVDWFITLIPMFIIVGISFLFFIFPEQSNDILGQIRFFFGDTFGTYYIVIGIGIFIVSIYLCTSQYGSIVLGESYEKPKYSFLTWGSMMFTCGLAADILFYSFSEWIMYADNPHIKELGSMGRSISFVSLEFYTMGVLSCAGSCVWIHAACKKKKTSAVF